jgi:hypothetical protein
MRLSYLGLCIFLSIFLLFWCFFGVVIYIGYGAFGFRIDVYVLLWVLVFLSLVWSISRSFRRAFKPPHQKSDDSLPPTKSGTAVRSDQMTKEDFDIERANKKLVSLLQKPKDPNGSE